MHITFQAIKMRQKVNYKCATCGKKRVKLLIMSNTINPFNRNLDGSVRTEQEVRLNVTNKLLEEVERFKTTDNYCTLCS